MSNPSQDAPLASPAIPEATIARLPGYLRVLLDLDAAGVERVSSTMLAEATGVQSALLRRDLSHFGSFGTRGVGYEVALLAEAIGAHVGTGTTWPVMLVGVGNMGRALARHLHRLNPAFRLVALVDTDPQVVGTTVAGLPVTDQADLEAVIERTGPRMVLITTPAAAAQEVADRVTAAGVTSILNVAPTILTVPAGVTVRTVNLLQELHILGFHEARRQGAGAESAQELTQ